MNLEQKIVDLIAEIEDILENSKDIYTNNVMEKDFKENYWRYRTYLDDKEVKWFWTKEMIETVVSFATDRIKDNKKSCTMKKKDKMKNDIKVYDCFEIGYLSVKSKDLYELICSLEARENKKLYVTQIIQTDKEKTYQFIYAKN